MLLTGNVHILRTPLTLQAATPFMPSGTARVMLEFLKGKEVPVNVALGF